MPTILQQRQPDGTVIFDLAPASLVPYFLVKDTLTYTPGAKNRVQSTQPGRKGGALTVLETEANGTLAAQWCVVGANADECWSNARTLIRAFELVAGSTDAGLTDVRIYWQPDGVAAGGAYTFTQDGSADWQHQYSWAQLTYGLALVLPATIAVRPVAW